MFPLSPKSIHSFSQGFLNSQVKGVEVQGLRMHKGWQCSGGYGVTSSSWCCGRAHGAGPRGAKQVARMRYFA